MAIKSYGFFIILRTGYTMLAVSLVVQLGVLSSADRASPGLNAVFKPAA